MSIKHVLVSGAGGKTGQAIVAGLRSAGFGVRPFLRRPSPDSDAFVGDMTSADDWMRALDGMDGLYHIAPNMHPDEVDLGRVAIQSSLAANLSHFVYHSVLHPQTQAMAHHWNKLRVEELLLASGLPFTILQPTAYMQNLRSSWESMRASAELVLPYPPTTAISLVDLNDVAAVVARVMLNPTHFYATYQLAATLPLTQNEVAAIISAEIGQKVTAVEIPLAEWETNARRAGLDGYALDTLLSMFRYYAAHGLPGNAETLRMVLGRDPSSLADCVRRW